MVTSHEDSIQQLARELQPVFEDSPDGVYVWLDDDSKFCNERLATMFGYSVSEWNAAKPFLQTFVDEGDQHTYASNYQNCVAALARPVTFRFRGKRKDGTTFSAETDMIPISWSGHAIAYHFVRAIGD